MTNKEEVVTLKDAIEQVETAVTRIALIHLGFSKTLVEELGEEKGKEFIKVIEDDSFSHSISIIEKLSNTDSGALIDLTKL